MSHLWVNMGAIYRQAGQYQAAESSYLQALALDEWQHSAMSNLVVLYGILGREQEQAYWRGRVENYRESNPYFYAELGDMAAERGEWGEALARYNQAIDLLPGDSQLLFTRGLIYYRLNDLDAAARDMSRAIELATLRSDIDRYQAQLEEVRQARLAGL
jgi:Flp pilus assembly protein TadD